jgi:hypothetical protein
MRPHLRGEKIYAVAACPTKIHSMTKFLKIQNLINLAILDGKKLMMFQILPFFKSMFTEHIRACAESWFVTDSGSTEMMRLLVDQKSTPPHCFKFP